MSFRVIGFCGLAGAGKDLAAQALIAQGYVRVSLADPIRESLLALDPYLGIAAGALRRLSEIVRMYGWQGAKQYPEVRRLLQRMGTEAGRDIHGQDCWTDIASDKLHAARRGGKPGAVITDVRFANEAEMVNEWNESSWGPALLLHIDRPGNGPANDHKSENLEQVFAMADAKIVNDGTVEELHAKVLAACGLEAVPA